MPQLKQLSCCLQWADTSAPFQEHGTVYGDGVVETFVIVPNKPQGFSIRLKSRGFISQGLAMIVFIDGNYQCNRSRVNLIPTKPSLPANRTEIDFLLRQKEKSQGDGLYLGREWRFDNHNILDETPTGFQESHFDDLGTIEVLVLRCRARTQGEGDYEGSSSGEDSDVFEDREAGEGGEGIQLMSGRLPAADAIAEQPAEEEDLSAGFMGLFDGAQDERGPRLGPDPADGSSGRWVWHQSHPPFIDLHGPSQHQLYHDNRSHPVGHSQPMMYANMQNQTHSYAHQPRMGKKVHFDDWSTQRHATYPQDPQRTNYYHHSQQQRRQSDRPPSRTRERWSSDSVEPRQGAPYDSQQTSPSARQGQEHPERLHTNQTSNPTYTSVPASFRGPESKPAQSREDQNHNPSQIFVPMGGRHSDVNYREHQGQSHSADPNSQLPANSSHYAHGRDNTWDNLQGNKSSYDDPQLASGQYQYQNFGHHDYDQNYRPSTWFSSEPSHHSFPHTNHPHFQPPHYGFHIPVNWQPYPTSLHGPLYGYLPSGRPMSVTFQPPHQYHPGTENGVSPTNTIKQGSAGAGFPPNDSSQQDPSATHAENCGNENVGQGWNVDSNQDNANDTWDKKENADDVNAVADLDTNNQNGDDNANGNKNDAAWEDTAKDGENNTGWDISANNDENDDWDATAGNNNAANDAGTWGDDATGNKTVDQQNQSSTPTPQVVRDLYGPHGPYYALRAGKPGDVRPEAEEEPRFDVPRSLAVQTGSTKQVQPGPGYRYFKKRIIPEYLDTMEEPYARFVFKYRTKDQLLGEIGIEIDVEPSGDSEIQDLQNLDKQALIEMLIRAKGALGGKIPSPPSTASGLIAGSENGTPINIDPPKLPHLKYKLPPQRPNKVSNQVSVPDPSKANNGNGGQARKFSWKAPNNVGTWENEDGSSNIKQTQTGDHGLPPGNGHQNVSWIKDDEDPPRPPTPEGCPPQQDVANDNWDAAGDQNGGIANVSW